MGISMYSASELSAVSSDFSDSHVKKRELTVVQEKDAAEIEDHSDESD